MKSRRLPSLPKAEKRVKPPPPKPSPWTSKRAPKNEWTPRR